MFHQNKNYKYDKMLVFNSWMVSYNSLLFSIKSFKPCISKIITSMIQHHIFYFLCHFHYIFYFFCPCSTSFGIAVDVKDNHKFVSHCIVRHPVRLWRYAYSRLQLYLLLYTKMPYYLKVSIELVVLQKALSDQV